MPDAHGLQGLTPFGVSFRLDGSVTIHGLDKKRENGQSGTMHFLLRPVLILFLAVFAAGMVMHTAAAAAMSLDMVLVQDKAMQMDDCAGCDGSGMEQGGAVCDMDCMLSFAATLPDAAALSPPPGPEPRVFPGVALVGRTGPPGLFPPRTTFLS